MPFALNALMALGTPLLSTLYVSTSRVAAFGYSLQYESNASYSLSNICTHECAIVPTAGMPKRSSAIAHAVLEQPPIYAALAPRIAAEAP